VNLIAHLEKLPYLDQDKAVLAGASYGGYMVSWFFGQEIINKVSLISYKYRLQLLTAAKVLLRSVARRHPQPAILLPPKRRHL